MAINLLPLLSSLNSVLPFWLRLVEYTKKTVLTQNADKKWLNIHTP